MFRNNISYLDESTTLLFDSKTSLNNFNRVIDNQINLKQMSVAYCSVPFFKPSFKCGSCDYCHRGVYETVYILAVGTKMVDDGTPYPIVAGVNAKTGVETIFDYYIVNKDYCEQNWYINTMQQQMHGYRFFKRTERLMAEPSK
jgi:hypothetical protein